jgi:hypothetical protein
MCHNYHDCLPKTSIMLDDVMGLPGQCSSGEGTTPLGKALPGCFCGTSSSSPVQTPLSCLCPLLGSQHPSGGLFNPMGVRTNHLPVLVQYGTNPSGMILHINRYTLHGIIRHSNVNHIQSSILLNMCIKSLLPSQVLKDIIQICKASLEEVIGRPIGLVSTGNGIFPEEIKSKSC